MKTQTFLFRTSCAFSAAIIMVSCNKNDLGSSNSSSVSTSSTIAVAASYTTSIAGSTDSVYLVQPCQRHEHTDSIAQSALPSSISGYLSSNYSGYNFAKAFALKNNSSVVTGYVVIIYYNNNPVGLQFDSAGNFVKVLEQREKADLDGPGWHHGGRFEHRDGLHRDTVALSALPSAITTYFALNYPTDTLMKAFKGRDSSFVILSKNNGLYATVFTYSGTFVKRDQLPTERGTIQSIELSALPSTASTYLSQTYPNYVFEKAFSFSLNGGVIGYVVVIDANNTKYAIEFDASGAFVKVKTVH